jgi:hypothetical protein
MELFFAYCKASHSQTHTLYVVTGFKNGRELRREREVISVAPKDFLNFL